MKKSAFFYIVIASVLWGTSGLFSYYLRQFGFQPVQMTAMRGVVAAILMISFVLITNPKLFKLPLKQIPFILGSGLGFFGAATAYFASMEASSVSTAVILMYTAPIFVLIYSVLFLGEKLNIVKSVSIFLMIVGCALVSGIVGGMKFSFWGVVYGLISGLSYSAYNIFAKILTMHRVHAYTVTVYNFIIVAVIGLAVSDPVGIIEIAAEKPIEIIPFIIGLGIFTSFLPYMLYTLGLRDIPAGTATTLGIIEPLSATIFSVAFLGETLTIPLIIGMILIFGAVIALARQK